MLCVIALFIHQRTQWSSQGCNNLIIILAKKQTDKLFKELIAVLPFLSEKGNKAIFFSIEEYMWRVCLDSSVVWVLARKVSLWLLGSIPARDLYFFDGLLFDRKKRKIALSNFLVLSSPASVFVSSVHWKLIFLFLC